MVQEYNKAKRVGWPSTPDWSQQWMVWKWFLHYLNYYQEYY